MLGSVPFDQIRTFHNLDAYPYGFERDSDVVQWAGALASDSPAARLLLKEAQHAGWSVTLDALEQGGYAIDEAEKTIAIDHFGYSASAIGRSAHIRHTMFINFIRALRQIWHDARGHQFETTHRPDAVLMLERARAADCETIAILVGWELRAGGHSELWRTIIGGEEGDMAMIFTRALEKDPAGFYDGSVLTRTFCQWYGDKARVAACDHGVLEQMDELLQERGTAGLPGRGALQGGDIEKLSCLPGGACYLAGMGANIAGDPYFATLDDPINESHLFQIAYDSKVVMVEGVPFRDKGLARLIFPGAKQSVKD